MSIVLFLRKRLLQTQEQDFNKVYALSGLHGRMLTLDKHQSTINF